MASNVIRVSILADAKQFERGFGEAQRKATTFGATVGTLAGSVVADLAGRALNAVQTFVKDSTRAFSDLEQAQGGTEAVFGDAAKAIDDFARQSAEAIGLSEAEFRTATTSIGGQLKRMTGDVNFAAEQSVILTQTAADLAATYGGTTAEAVQALGAAFRGEADPAERFNLDLKVSKVNAKAVEMGLAATTSSVDDYAKAQAILALVSEQSADAQGQFAREADTVAGKAQRAAAAIENQKAVIGELIAPITSLGDQAMMGLGRSLANVATEFKQLTGQITDGEAALEDWAVTNGRWAATADDVISVAEGTGTALADIIPEADLAREELEALRDRLPELAKQFKLTDSETEELSDAIGHELATALTDSEKMMRETAGGTAQYRSEQEDTEDAVEDTTSAIEEQADTLRAIADPMFGAIKASRDLKTAQENYNRAVEEYGEDSDEAIDALEEMVDANGDLMSSLGKLRTQGIDPTGEQARKMFKDIGLTDAQINAIFRQFDKIESNFESRVFKLTAQAPMIDYRQQGNKIVPVPAGGRAFAKGGIGRSTPGGIPGRIAEAGDDETVIPLNSEGARFMAQTMMEALRMLGTGGAGGGGTVINLTVNAGLGADGYTLGKQIVEVLQQYNRVGGPIRLDVRTE